MKRGVVALFEKLRQGLGSLFVCAVILVVPVFSLVRIGHTFYSHHGPARKATALPAFDARVIDSTKQPVQLFSEPLLSVTFDDGYESVYKQAMPLLQTDGIHSTQYILSGTESDPLYMSWDQIGAIQKAGHEIACHTVTHPDLTTLSDKDLNAQLSGCLHTLSQHFGAITDFASPYGAQNSHTLSAIAKYFGSQRNTNGDAGNGATDADVNLKSGFNPYNIIGVTIRRETTTAQLQGLIDYAKANNGWVVITYHQADEDSSEYGLDENGLKEQLAFLSKSDIRIVTMQQALASYHKKAGEH